MLLRFWSWSSNGVVELHRKGVVRYTGQPLFRWVRGGQVSLQPACCYVKTKRGRLTRLLRRPLWMVITERLERSTGSLEGCCSIQLSYVTIAFAAQK